MKNSKIKSINQFFSKFNEKHASESSISKLKYKYLTISSFKKLFMISLYGSHLKIVLSCLKTCPLDCSERSQKKKRIKLCQKANECKTETKGIFTSKLLQFINFLNEIKKHKYIEDWKSNLSDKLLMMENMDKYDEMIMDESENS